MPDSSETGETGAVRRLKVGIRSSEHFSLQIVSPVPPFPRVARTWHFATHRHESCGLVGQWRLPLNSGIY